jgi:diadenosine tetraphosphatase ApaH/serine/threonine PP2A family protein phosphatase
VTAAGRDTRAADGSSIRRLLEMRYAFFGDIHANLQALEAVLDDIGKQSIDELICMGDIVGYGANPIQCVERVRGLGCLCLAGNHDHAAIGKLDIEFFNLYAKQAAIWTRQQLLQPHIEYLGTTGFVEHLPDFVVAHGSIHGPEMFNYIQSVYDAQMSFDELDKPLMFHGHTHIPITFFNTDPMTYTMDPEVAFNPEVKTLVNVGSVGQPRDEDPRAAYGIYDDQAKRLFIRRVEYDIMAAGQEIRAAGLPEALAIRLELGK